MNFHSVRSLQRNTFTLLVAALLAACGGGGSGDPSASDNPLFSPDPGKRLPPSAAENFAVSYRPSARAANVPNGVVDVTLTGDLLAAGSSSVAKVELLLFGYEAQVLTAPAPQAAGSAEVHYTFAVPAGFGPDSYKCGSGEHLSEVRVTDIRGTSLGQQFELCPGVDFDSFRPATSSK